MNGESLRTTPLKRKLWEGTVETKIRKSGDLLPKSPPFRPGLAGGAETRSGDNQNWVEQHTGVLRAGTPEFVYTLDMSAHPWGNAGLRARLNGV